SAAPISGIRSSPGGPRRRRARRLSPKLRDAIASSWTSSKADIRRSPGPTADRVRSERRSSREGYRVQLGMIGLGRMGANMVRRLLRGGHQCVVFNKSPGPVTELVKEKAVGAASLAEFAKRLTKPRAAWLMVPVGAVDQTIADLVPHLEPGDILID